MGKIQILKHSSSSTSYPFASHFTNFVYVDMLCSCCHNNCSQAPNRIGCPYDDSAWPTCLLPFYMLIHTETLQLVQTLYSQVKWYALYLFFLKSFIA